MRIAALYDIHGNLPALEAVLAEVMREGVDRLVIGGDVLPGPMPSECLEHLGDLAIPVDALHGNGESAVRAVWAGQDPGIPETAAEAVRWTAEQLPPAQRALVQGWTPTLALDLPGLGRVLFCHATPESDSRIFTRRTPEADLLPFFAGLDADLVVCGHTHMPFDRTIGGVRVVNAGSVGMPFGRPGADWLLLGPSIHEGVDEGVRPRHTDYDTAAAVERLAATTYPDARGFAERYVLNPPSEEEMLRAFA